MIGYILGYRYTIGNSNDAFGRMQGMVGIMIFDAVRQLISKQLPYILVDDFQPECMRLVSWFHIKTKESCADRRRHAIRHRCN